MQKLRVFTAFSGYDSQCMALDRLQENYPDKFSYELVGWSEIDKYAIQAHNAVYPQWADRNFGDISTIDWSQVPDFDLFTYSSPCFAAGTMVLTKRGHVPIEELRPDDMVYTKEHRWRRVLRIGSDGVKPVSRVSAGPVLPLTVTDNHPFWVMRRAYAYDRTAGHYMFKYAEPVKTPVRDMATGERNVTDFIGVPIVPDDQGYRKDVTDEEMWLLGRFVADGHHSTDGMVIITVSNNKIKDFDKIKMAHKVHQHTKSCKRVVFNKHSRLYSLLHDFDFGRGALGKKIPVDILAFPREKLAKLLDGYMSGDGWKMAGKEKYGATTVSRALAETLVLLVQKVHRVGCTLTYQKRPPLHIIEGRCIHQHDTYLVRYQLDARIHRWVDRGDGFIWYPVKKEAGVGEEVIYNIEVEEDHTYTANNVAVFNCQDFSNAGKQAGGVEGSGTRSSLLWECRRAILAKKPKYLLMENVAALVGKKFIKLFNKWQLELQGYGYKNFPCVLNAKDYGVPQNRERIFLVSILDENARYEFPQPFKLEKRLKDVLEKDVDERYYLSDERVQKLISETEVHKERGNGFAFKPHTPDEVANTVKCSGIGDKTDNFLIEPRDEHETIDNSKESDKRE